MWHFPSPCFWSRFGSIPFQHKHADGLHLFWIRSENRTPSYILIFVLKCPLAPSLTVINALQEEFEAQHHITEGEHMCPDPRWQLKCQFTTNCSGSKRKKVVWWCFDGLTSANDLSVPCTNRSGTFALPDLLVRFSRCWRPAVLSFRNHSPLMSFGASFVSFLVSLGGNTEVCGGLLFYVSVVADGGPSRLPSSSKGLSDSNRK